MAISKGSSTGREACYFMLAVERYDDQNMECIVYERDREQGIRCHSFHELALEMEKGFEEMAYPTPSVQKRKFTVCRAAGDGGQQSEDRLVTERRRGKRKTFWVWVRQCQNATWQGQVSQNEDRGDGVRFESFLELLYLLDGILSDKQAGMGDEDTLTGNFTDALLLGGRYSGIWIKEQDTSGGLLCGRSLDGGMKETFAIRPMFRKNHTFQGSLYWSEGRQQKNFRSFLELLLLMMSAAGRQDPKEGET